MLVTASALLMRGAHRRRSCQAEQGVASPEWFATAPGRTTRSTPGATTPRAAIAAWSREERKQNAGPGQKTSRWSAERRGVGSLRRRALASKESESPRAVMHALRMHAASGRLSALRPPLIGAGNEKVESIKKRQRKEERREANEEKHSGQEFIALSSPRKRGPGTRAPRGFWGYGSPLARGRRESPGGLFDIVKREKRAIPRRRSGAGPRRSA